MIIKENYHQWFTIFFFKSASLNKSSGSGIINETNYQLANELHKPIVKQILKKKSLFII